MITDPAPAGLSNRTFSPDTGEKVFLCRSAVERVSRLCIRGAAELAVQCAIRLADSCAATQSDERFEQQRPRSVRRKQRWHDR
jgi:hypothetical protein